MVSLNELHFSLLMSIRRYIHVTTWMLYFTFYLHNWYVARFPCVVIKTLITNGYSNINFIYKTKYCEFRRGLLKIIFVYIKKVLFYFLFLCSFFLLYHLTKVITHFFVFIIVQIISTKKKHFVLFHFFSTSSKTLSTFVFTS